MNCATPTSGRCPSDCGSRWPTPAYSGSLLPQEYGGAGGTLTDLGVFCVEAGRGLCPTIVHDTLQAALAIQLLGGPDQHAAWLPLLAAGNVSATTCLWSARDAASDRPDAARPHRRPAAYLATQRRRRFRRGRRPRRSTSWCRRPMAGGRVGFVVPLAAAGLRIEPQPLMGGHRAFRIAIRRRRGGRSGMRCWPGPTARAWPTRTCAGSPTPRWRCCRWTWSASARRCCSARSITRWRASSSAGRSRRFRPRSIWWRICISRWPRRGWPPIRRCSGSGGATPQPVRPRLPGCMPRPRRNSITLDAHQLHGGMGYVVETDLHLFSERARVLSTLGGGADIAATWLEARRERERAEPDRRARSAARVGTVAATATGEVNRRDWQRWAAAVGDHNPLWFDPEYARAQGYRDIICPPLYLQYAILGVTPLDEVAARRVVGRGVGQPRVSAAHPGGWPAARARRFTGRHTTATRSRWSARSSRSSRSRAAPAHSSWSPGERCIATSGANWSPKPRHR